ncbi:hypothetical protein V6N13_148193 [Hibiscus sabdariffa]|uniref:Uncharacterized protein n=1 Tax=Hibiscus sabdariffa TaxID=183260 RepID=A0ABR2TXS8_9ROSI
MDNINVKSNELFYYCHNKRNNKRDEKGDRERIRDPLHLIISFSGFPRSQGRELLKAEGTGQPPVSVCALTPSSSTQQSQAKHPFFDLLLLLQQPADAVNTIQQPPCLGPTLSKLESAAAKAESKKKN